MLYTPTSIFFNSSNTSNPFSCIKLYKVNLKLDKLSFAWWYELAIALQVNPASTLPSYFCNSEIEIVGLLTSGSS